ncbi:hypothetical protein Ac2012v2_005093 [Leucoagaricus gongylophorus]
MSSQIGPAVKMDVTRCSKKNRVAELPIFVPPSLEGSDDPSSSPVVKDIVRNTTQSDAIVQRSMKCPLDSSNRSWSWSWLAFCEIQTRLICTFRVFTGLSDTIWVQDITE